MVALLILGTIVGLIWADTSDLAGAVAVVTSVVGGVGVLLLLIALVVTRRGGPLVSEATSDEHGTALLRGSGSNLP